MAAKNRLTAEDAMLVADAFEQRLSAWSITDGSSNDIASPVVGHGPQSGGDSANLEIEATSAPDAAQPTSIDKSALAVPAPRR
jgi:hypothetical protein